VKPTCETQAPARALPPGAIQIHQQEVLCGFGEFVGDPEHLSPALHPLLGATRLTSCFGFVFRHILSTFPGCFKPNECQKPAIFHETLVMDQLVQLLGELILDTDSTDTFTSHLSHLEPNESSNWHQAVASKCHHNQPPTSQVWNHRTGEDHARWLSKQMSLQRDCEALPPLELTHQQILIAHLDAWKPMVV
jgi:hypothetical protein